ncbi:MAG TPA: hypothetical protein H9830_09125 [Candidatus Agrococcus pullicola]|uniref:Uncharacterized protein n=1 Tax=Candidatus Agrococcus pullicola TaxID=2838429 RepID=A0A9D2C9L9_9MICO|nr:hypothetical protein [Candidatus Agrococcus pullicola]
MLRLLPHIPLFWVAPNTLQIGVQEPIARLDVNDEEAEAIELLRHGMLQNEFVVRCGRKRGTQLLHALRDALVQPSPDVRIRVAGSSPLASEVQRLARASGYSAGRRPANLFVSVALWELPELEWQRSLARQLPYLPIVLGDASIDIGPLWRPGRPCRKCARPAPPPLLPLADEFEHSLRLEPLEHAAVLGVVADAFANFATGEDCRPFVTVERGTAVITEYDLGFRDDCPCASDAPPVSGPARVRPAGAPETVTPSAATRRTKGSA